MNLHEKAKEQSKDRFKQPENFDSVSEGSGWSLYIGGNDWEDAPTAMAVVFPGNEEIKRVWAYIKFPRGIEGKVQSGELKSDRRAEAKQYAEKTWRAWLRVARRLHKEPKREFGNDWKTAFTDALSEPEVAKRIEEWGIDRTEWKATLESAARRVVAKLIEDEVDLEAEVDALPEMFNPEALGRALNERGLRGVCCFEIALADRSSPSGYRDMWAVYWNVPDGPEPYIDRVEKSQQIVYKTFNELYPKIRKFEALHKGDSFGLAFDPGMPATMEDFVGEAAEDDFEDEIDRLPPPKEHIEVFSEYGEQVFNETGECTDHIPSAETEDWFDNDEDPPDWPARLDLAEFRQAYPGRPFSGKHSLEDWGYWNVGGQYVPPNAAHREQQKRILALQAQAIRQGRNRRRRA